MARRGIGWRRRHDQSVVLLLMAVVVAVAAVVVKSYSHAWWLLAVAAVAAGLGAAVPWLKERAKGMDTRVELMGKCLRALDDRGRMRIVGELSLADFGVHPAHVEVDYRPRAVEADLVAALAEGRPVRVVGSSMAGKTRMAVQVVRDHYRDWPVVVPVPPRGLLDLVEGGGVPRRAVVWLDDLDRYLTGEGLPVEVLDRVVRAGCRVVATMRASANQQYQSDGGPRPREAELLERIEIVRLSDNPAERQQLAAGLKSGIRDGVLRYGLGQYVGSGYLAVQRYEDGVSEHPTGAAMVRAAVDWRRSGLNVITDDVLELLAPVYRPRQPSVRDESIADGLDWACARIDGVMSLIENAEGGRRAFDFIVDYLSREETVIPDTTWDRVQAHCPIADTGRVGYIAYTMSNTRVATQLFSRAAEAGDADAMVNLGVLLEQRGQSGEAETWYRRAAEAGDTNAMNNLGVLLEQRDESGEAETWLRRAAEAGHSRAMFNLGVLLGQRGKSGDAEIWFRCAAEAGDTNAMNDLGALLGERGESGEAETWLRRAAEAGHTNAMFNLGGLLGLRGESREAETWLRRAAEAGDGDGMFYLGALLGERGESGEAETWLRRAAEAGHTNAMFNLGALLGQRGESGKAETWYRRAADAGQADAIFNLGALLQERGESGEAETWLRRAAEAGHAGAMFNLGTRLQGRGESG